MQGVGWLVGFTPAAPETRRASVTDELLAGGPRLEHRILNVVGWRIGCELACGAEPWMSRR